VAKRYGSTWMIRGFVKFEEDGWEAREYYFAGTSVGFPAEFVQPQNCTDCHEDTGRHVSLLRPFERDYYHSVRGSDGCLPFHPWRGDLIKGRQSPLRISRGMWNPAVRHLFDYSLLPVYLRPRW